MLSNNKTVQDRNETSNTKCFFFPKKSNVLQEHVHKLRLYKNFRKYLKITVLLTYHINFNDRTKVMNELNMLKVDNDKTR